MLLVLYLPELLGLLEVLYLLDGLSLLSKVFYFREPPSFPTFQVKARLFCFVYKILAVTIRNIIP